MRSIVIPAAVALAAALGLPAPAQAAVQCGLILPTKVVIDAETVVNDMTLTSGCFSNQADHAQWDLTHTSSGTTGPINFEAADLADGDPNYVITFSDEDLKGRYALTPNGAQQADADPLTQNSSVTYVKYHSKLETTVTRTGTGLSWKATPYQWSGASHTNVKRRGVLVGLFHQTSSTAPWKYVKGSYANNASGAVYLSVGTTKAGGYRLVVAETPTVWASYSRTVKGRV